MGIIDEDGDIKQPSQFWDLGVVAIAAVFTACIIGMWFFSFAVPAQKAPPEMTVGLGQGSAIHQDAPPANAPRH
jgi:hypothetical protein